MSLAANALASFADAKNRFGYLDDEATVVEDLIGMASSNMEAYCRRKFAARDYTLILDGTGRDTLILPEYPVNSVDRLSVDTARAFAVASDVAATGYSIRGDEGIVRLYAGLFPPVDARDAIRVEFNAGYATTNPAFAVLRGACLEYVDWLKSRYARPGSIGRKGEYSADRVSVSFETDMPAHIRARLEPFSRVSA